MENDLEYQCIFIYRYHKVNQLSISKIRKLQAKHLFSELISYLIQLQLK